MDDGTKDQGSKARRVKTTKTGVIHTSDRRVGGTASSSFKSSGEVDTLRLDRIHQDDIPLDFTP